MLAEIKHRKSQDHWTVMEVLTAFVREKASSSVQPVLGDDTSIKLPTDIQTILTVIGRRTRTYGKGENQQLNFERSYLEKANLFRAHLEGAALLFVHLEGANLFRAYLEGAALLGTHLEGANLQEAHLEKALLFYVHLERANFEKAHLEGARISATDLTKVKNLTQDQVNTACIDEKTQLPEGLTKPAPCPDVSPPQ